MKAGPENCPGWTRILSEEDWQFIKRFLCASGSLKDLAAEYGISYPTVRGRLDRLIEKIKTADRAGEEDDFRVFIRSLAIDGHLATPIAREIIREHDRLIKRSYIDARNDNTVVRSESL
jgi:hypothetical protein